MNDSCVSIRSVFKTFGSVEVLKDIDLDIQKGEIFGLLGPSGAGKTTLVKELAGLEVPTSGEINVFQEEMPSLHLIEKLGYMAQSDALYLELTARENLEFFAALYGLRKRERKQRLVEVMELVQLTDHLDKQVSNYSGGMKRRLSLAIALLHKPELLILDEPTVGIDPVLRRSVWEAFHQLKKEGKTLIVTTHVMDEAEKCDRLGLMREGRLIAVGTPEELKQETGSNSIEEAFLAFGGVSS
ncbi:ABC transporter ATP-binding protein [Bacillus norwichensis]|uniref:ABC transporter ATP-binding protein n=1 Tax=Bacillus norwichensis TaxID=2762217 RepID=A0ABR8VNZ8_9BACI|nr:ABC transporter ATP-binding protein [Bacillus norwichensis]MBD8006499.1 ABC transporter ATP-binding protein [Bacillus norwichensis]